MSNDHAIAHAALGILGNIASCIFFLSSAPTVARIVRCKSTDGISGDLYVFKLFNCLLWSLYGLPFVHPHDFWVVLTNSFGCVFALMYIIPYLCYATTKERVGLLWKLCVIVSSFIIIVVLTLVLEHSQQNRIYVVGSLSAAVSSGMHMTLLSQCGMAIKSKDAKYLHPDASLTAFMKGAIWTSYGIVNFDIFILIPNGIGVLIGVIQVVMVVLMMSKRAKETKLSGASFEDKGSKRNSMEVCPESTNGCIELETCEQQTTEAGVTPPLIMSRVSSLLGLPRQGSMSCVVVPIILDDNDVNAHTTHVNPIINSHIGDQLL